MNCNNITTITDNVVYMTANTVSETINPQIPKSVNDIVVKAMQKDPNLRYASATEMIKDLNLSLKNPDGNFVYVKNGPDAFKTQQIPVIEPNSKKKSKENRIYKIYKTS